MYQVIIVFHVLLGLGIIGLVLMQQGKGADAGAAFGAGASGSVFGAQGAASFLSRSTAILATLFFITSLSLAVYNSHKGKGIAYDFMSDKSDDKEISSLPEVDGAKKAEPTPVIPAIKTEETPVVPIPAAPEKPAATEPPLSGAAKITNINVEKSEASKSPETKPDAEKSNRAEKTTVKSASKKEPTNK